MDGEFIIPVRFISVPGCDTNVAKFKQANPCTYSTHDYITFSGLTSARQVTRPDNQRHALESAICMLIWERINIYQTWAACFA